LERRVAGLEYDGECECSLFGITMWDGVLRQSVRAFASVLNRPTPPYI
jgi:hypothetical protein